MKKPLAWLKNNSSQWHENYYSEVHFLDSSFIVKISGTSFTLSSGDRLCAWRGSWKFSGSHGCSSSGSGRDWLCSRRKFLGSLGQGRRSSCAFCRRGSCIFRETKIYGLLLGLEIKFQLFFLVIRVCAGKLTCYTFPHVISHCHVVRTGACVFRRLLVDLGSREA